MKGTCEQIPFHFFLKFMMLGEAGGPLPGGRSDPGGDRRGSRRRSARTQAWQAA